MTAILALRRAIHARLTGDRQLAARLDGPRIHDEPPRAASGTYVVCGDVSARDWSSDGARDGEQEIEIVVWGGQTGDTVTALTIAARVGTLLHDASLKLTGHRLVNLRQLAPVLT